MRINSAFLAIAILGACTSPREAPVRSDSKVVQWSATAAAPRVVSDTLLAVDVDLRAVVEPGWHIYSLTQGAGGPVKMSVKVSPPYTLAGEISGPKPERAQDPNFGIESETYSGTPAFRLPVTIARSASSANSPIELKVRSQACSDRLCLPARTITVTLTPGSGST